MVDYEFIKANNIWVRHGECSRCGKCCYVYHKRDTEAGRIPCEHLEFNNEGLAVCKLGDNKPQICKDFPLYPFREADKDFFKDCTYYWELDISLSKEEALERLNKICTILCTLESKESCVEREITVNQINAECQ